MFFKFSGNPIFSSKSVCSMWISFSDTSSIDFARRFLKRRKSLSGSKYRKAMTTANKSFFPYWYWLPCIGIDSLRCSGKSEIVSRVRYVKSRSLWAHTFLNFVSTDRNCSICFWLMIPKFLQIFDCNDWGKTLYILERLPNVRTETKTQRGMFP